MRDKVYANTAFADPRHDDHLGVELTSLLMFTGEDFCVDKHGLTLGAAHVYVSGKIAARFYSGVPPILPEGAHRVPREDPSTSRVTGPMGLAPGGRSCKGKDANEQVVRDVRTGPGHNRPPPVRDSRAVKPKILPAIPA